MEKLLCVTDRTGIAGGVSDRADLESFRGKRRVTQDSNMCSGRALFGAERGS